jgi:hypothetical protein
MKMRAAITADRQVDPRWGRACRVTVAGVADGEIRDRQELTLAWERSMTIGPRVPPRPGSTVPARQPGPGDRYSPCGARHGAHARLDGDPDRRRPERRSTHGGPRGYDHGPGTALVRDGHHRYRMLPRKPTPHEHVPPGKPPFNILNCRWLGVPVLARMGPAGPILAWCLI